MSPVPYLAALLLFHPQGQSPTPDDPAGAVWLATRAVEGDSAAAVAGRWRARLRRDARDRAAALGLATLVRLTYDYATAEREYTRLLPRPGTAPDRVAVHARMGLAAVRLTLARFREAGAELERVAAEARAVGDTGILVEALASLALARFRTGGLAAAESVFAVAAPLAPAAGARAEATFRCARALSRVGNAPALVEEAREAAAFAARAGERRLQAVCLSAAARDLIRRGLGDSASVTIREVIALQASTHDRFGLAASLQWWGWYLSALGDYQSARRHLVGAVAEGEAAGNQSVLAWALGGLATVALRLGDIPAARAYGDRARALFTAQGDQTGLVGALGAAADAARTAGDFAAARARYGEAIAGHARSGNHVGVVAMRQGLAELAMAEGNWTEAERELEAARRLTRERRMTGWERGLDWAFAQLALARGDLIEAERLLRERLAVREHPYRGYKLRARLAEIHARRGEIDAAARELAAATTALDSARALMSERELRVLAFQIQEDWWDPDLGIATVLAALAAGGRVAEAFALAERRRARELRDALARAEVARVTTPQATASPGRSARASPDATTAAVGAALPDDRTALLEYVTGRRGELTTLFVVTRAGATAHPLAPIDSLAPTVARFVALTEAGTAPRALAERLGEELLGPAVRTLPPAVTRLVIVADDVLHRVPFDALALGAGPVAVERFTVTLAPSAGVALELWGRPPRADAVRALALGDPAFTDPAGGPAAGEAASYVAAFRDAGGLPRLRESGAEARALTRVAPDAEVRLRGDASEAFVVGAPLDAYRIIHFATHAVVDERALTRTALALAPGSGEDGFLGPGDLAALRLDADLVVLSACRTAGGVVVRGEGVQGLTAPLLEAGARSVMATLWRVGDRRTRELVERFYRSLAAGVPAGDALRVAKLDALKRGRPAGEWAAFTLVGDPTVRLALPPSGR